MLNINGFADCKPISTPMGSWPCTAKNSSHCLMKTRVHVQIPYRSAFGLPSPTWADALSLTLPFAVVTLAKYKLQPFPVHWKAVKHVFQILRATKTMKWCTARFICWCRRFFITYTVPSWCMQRHRQIHWWLHVVNNWDWCQSLVIQAPNGVALSSTEARVLAELKRQDLKWMRSLLENWLAPLTCSTLWHWQHVCINVIQNPEHHGRYEALGSWIPLA